MKKIIILLAIAVMVITGCASYITVSSEQAAQVEEIRSMDKLGVVVLLKTEGNGHLMIGEADVPEEEQEWSVGDYNELAGSAVIGVKASTIRKKYLPKAEAAAEIAEAAAEVLGNGPVYDYGYVKGYSLRPDRVSNQAIDSNGNTSYIEAPDVIVIDSDFDYNAKDKELIPFALRQGKEQGIDGLIVIQATLIAEGGKITSFSSGDSTGTPMGEWSNSFNVGDFFARSEVYIDSCSVIDANTGEYVVELFKEITGFSVLEGKSFYNLSGNGISDHEGLRRYFQTDGYRENVKASAAPEMALLVPYLRPHFHTTYEAE